MWEFENLIILKREVRTANDKLGIIALGLRYPRESMEPVSCRV